MKTVDFQHFPELDAALTDISVIYQTPTWTTIQNSGGGRILNGFLLIDKGACRYTWEGNSADLTPGSLIYLPCGTQRTVTVTERIFSFYRVSFLAVDLHDRETVVFTRDPWVVGHSVGEKMFHLCRQMQETTLSPSGKLESTALLYLFFREMQKLLQKKNNSRIAAAVEYLNRHYTENTDVKTLAELCYLSEPHLFRLFKKETGQTPVDYRNTLRVRRAQELLQDGECSVTEVASMLGFDSIYYFDRVFRKYTGNTPGNYKPPRGDSG